MNERIRELREQALYWSGENVNRNLYSNYEIEQKEYEKFAELIVRECCGAADEWYQKHNELHWDPAQHIRNHFGVEE